MSRWGRTAGYMAPMGHRKNDEQALLFPLPDERCRYCGRARATTADHTPPRALLRPPLPSNLKTVPACRECNQAFSFDEQTVQALFTLLGTHPDLVAARTEGGRQARAFARNRLLRDVFERSRQPDGSYALTDEILGSLDRVARKTVQGLYHGLYGVFVPGEGVQLLHVADARQLSGEALAEQLRPSPLELIDVDQPSSEVGPRSWHARQPIVVLSLRPPDGGPTVERYFRLKQATPVEWIDLQVGIFRFAFVGRESGDAACVMELWETLVLAVSAPWPSARGAMRRGRTNPLSRERRSP